MLRVGLVGFGAMGRHHARVLLGLDGVQLVGIADPAPSSPASALGAPVVDSVSELLSLGVDYVVVATPTETHERIARLLVTAGIPTLIEKPLAATSTQALTLADEFARAGVLGAVGHVERFNPAVQQARERIERGDLGTVYQVATRRLSQFPVRIGDVGVALDLASHDIDAAAFLVGGTYRQVSAQALRPAGRDHEDLVCAVARMDSPQGPVVVSHTVNWLSPFKERSIVVTGTQGVFAIDTLTADLTYYANGTAGQPWDDVAQFRGVSEGDVTRFAFAKREPLVIEHEAFRDAVAGDRADDAAVVTLAQAAQVVCVAEAMLMSARGGITVDL